MRSLTAIAHTTTSPFVTAFGWVIITVIICVGLLVVVCLVAPLVGFIAGMLGQPPRSRDTPGSRRSRPPIPLALRTRVLTRDAWQCVYCGAKGQEALTRGGLQMDHIIPLSKGGATVYANLQVTCGVCNERKGAN